MSKVRKAIAAFVAATLGAAVTAVVTDGMPADAAGWFALAGAAVGVGLAAAYAVWRTPNEVPPPASNRDAAVRRSYS